MAKGITNRLHLNLPMFRRSADIAALEQRVDESLRVIDRWANNLPFGAVGFHFRRSTNESATGSGLSTTITWNTVIEDREGFMPPSGSTQTITVPRERSGLYVFKMSLYYGVTSAANQYPWIAVNGLGITNGQNYTAANTYTGQVIGFALLNDGDEITAGNLNSSGGAITITAGGGGGPYDLLVPSLQAWRISLL